MSNIQTIIDIGFIALVTITCCRALMLSQSPRSEQDAQRRTEQWQGELQQVEGVLRRLVADATSAGQSLDRQLSRRHEELSALVRRIDQHKVPQNYELDPNHLEIATENAVSAAGAQAILDDLPNPTWNRTVKSTPAAEPSNRIAGEDLIAKLAPATAKRTETPLSTMIEIETREEAPRPSAHEEIIAQLPAALGVSMVSSPDLTAYKVAARLLSNGKEIHLVARKLSLPIHEVRALERLLRGENAEHAPSYDEKAPTATASAPPSRNNISASIPAWTLGDEREDLELENPIFSRDVSLL